MSKILIAICTLFVLSVQAQQTGSGKLTGKVLDSLSQSPLEYASITLIEQPASKAVNGGVTDKFGRFSLTGIKSGTYTLLIEAIGYIPVNLQNIIVDESKGPTELNPIALAITQKTLQNITVTTTGKLVTNKIDKFIYNVEHDITSQSGSATDALRKVPQVSVDISGNVELAGSSSIRFLINGKPSTAFGSSVAEVLQSLPASQIKSIEVVTNPGAKYDAQGLGGIINIVLKQSNAQGINGNLSISAGTRVENGSFNFNARKGRFGMNAFISGNFRPAVDALVTSTRSSTDTVSKTTGSLRQNGISRFHRGGFQTGIGLDWSPSKKSTFTGSLAYDRFGNNGHGFIRQQQQLYSQTMGTKISDVSSETYTKSHFWLHTLDADINYKLTFDKEDQELEIGVTSSFGQSFTNADNYQLVLPELKRFYGNMSTNPGKENETEFTIDYTHPLKENAILGVGAKLTTTDIGSASAVFSFQSNTNSYAYDNFLSNNLDYHQKVYAGYTEVSFAVGKLFDAKVGGRYERTEIASMFSNTQQQPETPGYNTLVPSVFLSKKLGEDQLLKLSYSKRIERPDYGDLNPFINTSDPKSLTAGNPYLRPEVGHRVEAAYNREVGKIGSVSATIFYRLNLDDIQPFIRYYAVFQVGDSIYTNVAVTRRENIGEEKNSGVMLFSDLHPNPKLGFRTNLMLFHRHTINQQDPGYNSNSFNYRFNTNASYQISPTFVVEFFGNFNSPRNEAQGRYPSTITYSFAARKQFWNKKGSLALTATNPFANYLTQRTELFGPGFTINSVRHIPVRSFGINFTWKFGKLEFKKEPEESKTLPTDN